MPALDFLVELKSIFDQQETQIGVRTAADQFLADATYQLQLRHEQLQAEEGISQTTSTTITELFNFTCWWFGEHLFDNAMLPAAGALLPRSAVNLTKKDSSYAVIVQDPFDLTFNCTRSVAVCQMDITVVSYLMHTSQRMHRRCNELSDLRSQHYMKTLHWSKYCSSNM